MMEVDVQSFISDGIETISSINDTAFITKPALARKKG